MPVHHEGTIQSVLDKLLEEHGLTPDTQLYREAEREILTPERVRYCTLPYGSAEVREV